MTPTPAQIAAGVAEAKAMVAEYNLPPFIADQITDDKITEGVTRVLIASLAAGSAS